MSRLILLRHATAERAAKGESDHARALTKGGRKESQAAGRLLAARGESVDLVLCSDSRRTQETWEGVQASYAIDPEVRFLRPLFEAPNYLPVLRSEGGAAGTILLIGHNPAMHATALGLAENLGGRDGARLRDGFPKGAFAVLDSPAEWASLRPGGMRLVAFIEPGEE
jgi:phosphohistidine phosphatase